MVVDFIRSGYRTTMRFFADSDLEIPVRWYRCQPGALPFPGYNRFASGNNSSPAPTDERFSPALWQGVGEVGGAPREYSKEPAPLWATGQKFCGTLEEFAGGCVFDPDFEMPLHADGGPLCCHDDDKGGTSAAAGGNVQGGSAVGLAYGPPLYFRGGNYQGGSARSYRRWIRAARGGNYQNGSSAARWYSVGERGGNRQGGAALVVVSLGRARGGNRQGGTALAIETTGAPNAHGGNRQGGTSGGLFHQALPPVP